MSGAISAVTRLFSSIVLTVVSAGSILNPAFHAFPLLLGIVFFSLPANRPEAALSIKRMIYLLLLITLWRLCVPRILSIKTQKIRLGTEQIFSLVLLVALILMSLQGLRFNFSEDAFFIIAAVFGLETFSVHLKNLYPLRSILLSIISSAAIGFLSCLAITDVYQIDFIVLSFSLACIMHSVKLAELLQATSSLSDLYARFFATLVYSGPMLFSFLVYQGLLNSAYLLVFIPMLLAHKVVRSIYDPKSPQISALGVIQLARGNALAVILILITLKFVF